MKLEQEKKEILQNICKQRGIDFLETDTRLVLINKIKNFAPVEEDKKLPHVVEEKLKKVYYKSKQRWVYLGEFESKKDILKALRKKGSKIYKIE